MAFTDQYGYNAILAKAADLVNDLQTSYLIKRVIRHIKENKSNTVSVLGLSYKPDTPVIEESPSIKLIEGLLKENLEVVVYDSLAMDNTRAIFEDKIIYVSSLIDCIASSSVCVIATQADEFKLIDESYITHNPTVIIDCWRMLDSSKFGQKVKYEALGKNYK
jgi:UDPglucose 6-dehydrogenase